MAHPNVNWETNYAILQEQMYRSKDQMATQMRTLEEKVEFANRRADVAEKKLALYESSSQIKDVVRQKDQTIIQLKQELTVIRKMRDEELQLVDHKLNSMKKTFTNRIYEGDVERRTLLAELNKYKKKIETNENSSQTDQVEPPAPYIPKRPISTLGRSASSNNTSMTAMKKNAVWNSDADYDRVNDDYDVVSQEDFKNLPSHFKNKSKKVVECASLDRSGAVTSNKNLEVAKSMPMLAVHNKRKNIPDWERRIYSIASSGFQLSDSHCESQPQIVNLPPSDCIFDFSGSDSCSIYTHFDGRIQRLSHFSFENIRDSRDYALPPDVSTNTSVDPDYDDDSADYCIPPDCVSDEVASKDYLKESDLRAIMSKSNTSSSLSDTKDDSLISGVYSGYVYKFDKNIFNWVRCWAALKKDSILFTKYDKDDVVSNVEYKLSTIEKVSIDEESLLIFYIEFTNGKRLTCLTEVASTRQCWFKQISLSLLSVAKPGSSFDFKNLKPLTIFDKGEEKKAWALLHQKQVHLFNNRHDKRPFRSCLLDGAVISHSKLSSKRDGTSFESSVFLISVICENTLPLFLIVHSKGELNEWLYQLLIGSGWGLKNGTTFEQLLVGLIFSNGFDKIETLFALENLTNFTTLTSPGIKQESEIMHKKFYSFIKGKIVVSNSSYFYALPVHAFSMCLKYEILQNEAYCLLMHECYSKDSSQSVQAWQLLSIAVSLFLPSGCFLWLFKHHLSHNAQVEGEIGKYAMYCQKMLERTANNGGRLYPPSKLEMSSLLLRNPYEHSFPMSIPVHFPNGSYHVVAFDGVFTVKEFLASINEHLGMRDCEQSGFALFANSPIENDVDYCLDDNAKVADIITKWETAELKNKESLLEKGKSSVEKSRSVKFSYRNRLYFPSLSRFETENESLFMVYQINTEIVNGRFPISKELAPELVALMSQIHHGNITVSAQSLCGKSSQLEDCFSDYYPLQYRNLTHDKKRSVLQVIQSKWIALADCKQDHCVDIYLNVVKRWKFFGGKLFSLTLKSDEGGSETRIEAQVWLVVRENVIALLDHARMTEISAFSFNNLVLFGGENENLILVFNNANTSLLQFAKSQKLTFSAKKTTVLEIINLISLYIKYSLKNSTYLPNFINQNLINSEKSDFE